MDSLKKKFESISISNNSDFLDLQGKFYIIINCIVFSIKKFNKKINHFLIF